MNRSVMNRQMFAKGGPVRYMQQGGVAAPMPMAAPPAPMPMAAPPPAPMPMAAPPPMDPMAAAQEAINPAELEGMLAQASQTIGDLDQAGSYEEVMNMMRGDEASVQERRSELAGLVGPEDAQQTPESVLTLVQPVIQMASVDQGIGGLAQEQMSAPVEGDMAGGIMSTVGMGAPEGPPPVNFNQGGVVRRPGRFPEVMLPDFTSVMEARPSGYLPQTPMYLLPPRRIRLEDLDQPIPEAIRGMPRDYREEASSYEQETLDEAGNQLPGTQAAMEGTDPSSESAELATDTVDPLDSLMSELGYGDERSLDEYFQESRDLYRGLISEADRQASRSDVREAAKTQFLSDLGKAGLLLASPTASPMSFFEKLSGAVSGSEMFDNLAKQAAAISEAEREFRAQDLKLDLAALTDAQKRSLADQDARRALQLKMLDAGETDASLYSIFDPEGNLVQTQAYTDSELRNATRNLGRSGFTIRPTAEEDISATGGGSQEQYFVLNPDTRDVETFDFGAGPQSNISLQDGAAFNRAATLLAGSGLMLVKGTDLDKFGQSGSGSNPINVRDTTGAYNDGATFLVDRSELEELQAQNAGSNFVVTGSQTGAVTGNVLIEGPSGVRHIAGQSNSGSIVNDGLIPGAGNYVTVNQLQEAGYSNITSITDAEVSDMRNAVAYGNYFVGLAEKEYGLPPAQPQDFSRDQISDLTGNPISNSDYRDLQKRIAFDMNTWARDQSEDVVRAAKYTTGLGPVAARVVDSALGIAGFGFTGDSVHAKQTAKLFNKMILPGLVTNASRVSNFDIQQVQPLLLDVGVFGSDNTQLAKMVQLYDLLKYKEASIINKGLEESSYGVMSAERFKALQTDLSAVRSSLTYFGNNFQQEVLEQFPSLSDEMQRRVINNDPERQGLYNNIQQQNAAFRSGSSN